MTSDYQPFPWKPTPPTPTPTPQTGVEPIPEREMWRYTGGLPPLGGLLESGSLRGADLVSRAKMAELAVGAEEAPVGTQGLDLSPEGIEATYQDLLTKVAQGDLYAADALKFVEKERNRLLGLGGAGSIFSPQEERLMTDLQNAVNVGSMSDEQAWKEIESYWSEENLRSRRSEEAGRRGETLLAGAFPGKTFPGTGPGGIGAKLAEKWGGPNLMPALQGIPMAEAQGIFGQAQQGMGLPAQLPPIQPPQPQMMNWQALGQNLPSFGGGGGNKYFEALLQQGRSTAPAL